MCGEILVPYMYCLLPRPLSPFHVEMNQRDSYR